MLNYPFFEKILPNAIITYSSDKSRWRKCFLDKLVSLFRVKLLKEIKYIKCEFKMLQFRNNVFK
jgi:hypothetical protein